MPKSTARTHGEAWAAVGKGTEMQCGACGNRRMDRPGRFAAMQWLIVGLLVMAWTLPALGQLAGGPLAEPTTLPTAEPGSELTVYLVTMGPGEAIYEKFGHNAIWVRDRQRGTDVAYNYGVFDMGEAGFILRFLQGRMWYWLEAWGTGPMIDVYKQLGRTIWVQELNLTTKQRVTLRDFLQWNAQPENNHYRYDYYADNCSTRVRDALDRAVNGQIQQQLKAQPTERTYRWHTRRIMASDPLMYTALYFVLGQPVDRPLSAWEECFLPMEMQRYLRGVTVVDESGQRVPLVKRELTLFEGSQAPLADRPPNWWGYYLALGLALAGLMAGLGWLAPERRWARWNLAAVSGVWLLVVGGAGVFLAGAWLLTSHGAVYYNENLFQFSPLALPLAVLLPALALRAGWGRWLGWVTLCLMALVAGSAVAGVGLKVLPAFDQVNGELLALLVPVQLALMGVVYWLGQRTGTEANTPDAEIPTTNSDGRKGQAAKGKQGREP